MKNTARKWLAASVLLAASGLALWGVASPLATGGAHAAAPAGQSGVEGGQGQTVRRESTMPTWLSPVRLTGPASPYTPLDIPSFGENYRANTDTQTPNLAQQEPSISINPLDPLNVVAAAKDERGGTNTKQIWIYTSTDGGVTWMNQLFPHRTPLPAFSSDPVVNFSDDGICYVTSLPYGSGSVGIQVATSTDGGVTFSTGTQVTTNSSSDKEWTWIDNFPSSPFYHRMYVAWMNFSPGFTVTYSSDRGQTWVQTSVAQSANQFPQPVVLPNGDVIVTYRATNGAASFIRSTNGGVNFSTAQAISSITTPQCPPDNSGCSIWRMSPIPANSVNRNNGAMVLLWADGRNGTASTYASRSTDNGATWSAAAAVAPSGIGGTYQVEPWVEADEQGIFHAIWYDNRENPNTSVFHIYYSQSTDDGATWSNAVRISTATSDLRIGIPTSYSRAAGDYINVTAHSGNVYATWTDTRSGTGEDVYVVRGIYGGGTPTPSATGTPPTATVTRTNTPVPTSTPTEVPTNTSVPTDTPTQQATATDTPVPTGTAVATETPCPMNFSDVQPSDYFYVPVRYLYCAGAISGYSDGTFRPYNNTTRGQLTKIVVLAEGWQVQCPTPGHFTDVPPSDPFFCFIETAYGHGIISGYSDGTFRPGNNVTRAQLCKIIVLAEAWADDCPTPGHFSDVPPSDPFFCYIETLYNHGVISGYADGTFRPGASATRGQISKIVYEAVTGP
jgi:hypothetical protein